MEAWQENNTTAESQNLLIQNTKSMYPEHMNLCLMKIYGFMASEESKGNLFEFIACIVACRKSHVSRVARHQRVLFHPSLRLQKRETYMLALLEVVPETD
ncbi:hypothetical protein NC652_006920 [Populus alba x Populus x berolinensis]|nr:hypothetical protein NC652_006920 [Populus alba x Populus x berolinensis]